MIVAEELRGKGVGSILDYAVEGEENEEGFEETVRIVGLALERNVEGGFACVKLSGVGRRCLFEVVDEVMREKDMDGFGVGEVGRLGSVLGREEKMELESVLERMQVLGDKARKFGCGLVIDAEEYSMCRAVDLLSLELQRLFNDRFDGVLKGCRGAHVYMTFQMYLRDAEKRWNDVFNVSKQEGFVLGVKAVRGAYLEHERRVAAENGRTSPVWDDASETHHAFDRAVQRSIQHIADGKQALIVATHNEESLQGAFKAARDAKVDKQSPCLHMAQLQGMRDSLTFAAKEAGFNALKYVPFGPVGKTLPYLLRRLEENRDLFGGAREEIILFLDELRHRRVLM